MDRVFICRIFVIFIYRGPGALSNPIWHWPQRDATERWADGWLRRSFNGPMHNTCWASTVALATRRSGLQVRLSMPDGNLDGKVFLDDPFNNRLPADMSNNIDYNGKSTSVHMAWKFLTRIRNPQPKEKELTSHFLTRIPYPIRGKIDLHP